MNKIKLTYIEWEDSVTVNSEWNTLEDILEWAKNDDCLIKQAGFLLEENDRYILLASQYNPQVNTPDKYGVLHKIPKTWIRKRQEIRIK